LPPAGPGPTRLSSIPDAAGGHSEQRLVYRKLRYVEFLGVNSTPSPTAQTPRGPQLVRAGIRNASAVVPKPNFRWTVFQQGTHSPADGNNRWQGPSGLETAKGDIVRGYRCREAALHHLISATRAGRPRDPENTLSEPGKTLARRGPRLLPLQVARVSLQPVVADYQASSPSKPDGNDSLLDEKNVFPLRERQRTTGHTREFGSSSQQCAIFAHGRESPVPKRRPCRFFREPLLPPGPADTVPLQAHDLLSASSTRPLTTSVAYRRRVARAHLLTPATAIAGTQRVAKGAFAVGKRCRNGSSCANDQEEKMYSDDFDANAVGLDDAHCDTRPPTSPRRGASLATVNQGGKLFGVFDSTRRDGSQGRVGGAALGWRPPMRRSPRRLPRRSGAPLAVALVRKESELDVSRRLRWALKVHVLQPGLVGRRPGSRSRSLISRRQGAGRRHAGIRQPLHENGMKPSAVTAPSTRSADIDSPSGTVPSRARDGIRTHPGGRPVCCQLQKPVAQRFLVDNGGETWTSSRTPVAGWSAARGARSAAKAHGSPGNRDRRVLESTELSIDVFRAVPLKVSSACRIRTMGCGMVWLTVGLYPRRGGVPAWGSTLHSPEKNS